MNGSGLLDQSVAFDSPVQVPDGSGGTDDDWSQQFAARAEYIYLRGGETVQAARLDGRQPVVVRLISTDESRAIKSDWRMRDLRTGDVYNVRSISHTGDKRWVEVLAETGVAS